MFNVNQLDNFMTEKSSRAKNMFCFFLLITMNVIKSKVYIFSQRGYASREIKRFPVILFEKKKKYL